MSNYVLSIKTKEGSFYGGSIKAASVDDADEAAFSIYTNLQQEGFNSIQDIEAIDYFNLNGSLPIPDNIELFYYVTYHRLNIDENVKSFDGTATIYSFVAKNAVPRNRQKSCVSDPCLN